MKILNFGSCNIDLVYSMDHIVLPGETQTSEKVDRFAGGKGLNQSIALARAGAQVYHAGCIGHDGQFLLDMMRDSGVDVSCIKRVAGPNGHAIIQVGRDGQNAIFLYSGSNAMVDEDDIDEVLAQFAAGDILLLQNEISNVPYLVDRAYEKKMRILLNPSPYNDTLKEVDMGKVSCLILNQVEAEQMTGLAEPEAAISYLHNAYPGNQVMLTLGHQGCVFSDGKKLVRQKAFSVKAVDTTAAGDTFTGYFVAGIANAISWEENLKLASAAAAIAVTRQGAAPSIPERSEVLQWLEEA